MGGRGSGGSKNASSSISGNKTTIKIAKDVPKLKNLNDANEVNALKTKTLSDIERLEKKYNWYGDKKLNEIKTKLQFASNSDGESVLMLADDFYSHKPKYIKRVKWMERGY